MEMTIGANIKRLRTAKNITQEQLSVAMNVTCAAVSKWERGETYPDITLLQPLAYFFGVTLDELMGYNQEKIQAEIDEIIALYRQHWNDKKGREIIVKARDTSLECDRVFELSELNTKLLAWLVANPHIEDRVGIILLYAGKVEICSIVEFSRLTFVEVARYRKAQTANVE